MKSYIFEPVPKRFFSKKSFS